jgi:glucose/arabinose dehydrogenase
VAGVRFLAGFWVLALISGVALLLSVGGGEALAGRSATVRFVPYASGFSSPVYATTAPNDPSTLYVVEQAGTIRMVKNHQIAGTFLDIRSLVTSGGELGLLSMAFSPHYATNHLFYVSYTDRHGNSRIVQYRSAGGVGVRSSAKILLTVLQPFDNHKGGQLQFDKRGYLYVGFGDGGSEGDPHQTAQNLSSRLGKLLRSRTTTPNDRWKMVGLGLRNPWRFSFDSKDNLWIGDVGQDKWEEVDFRPAARLDKLANYGWSRYEGDSVYDASHRYTKIGQKVFPVLVYPHTQGRCAIIGGYVVKGRYYYGDNCSGGVWSFRTDNHGRAGPARAAGSVPSISAFGIDGAGHLFGVSLNGTIYELK